MEGAGRVPAGRHAPLRTSVLAAAVLDDLPAAPTDDGAGVGPHPRAAARCTWRDVEVTVGAWAGEPAHVVTRLRLAALVAGAGLLAEGGPDALAAALRVHVEPAGSPLHPGPDWVRTGIGDGPVQAGWGLAGPPGGATTPLPPAPTLVAGLPPGRAERLWERATADVERWGLRAAERLARDDAEGRALVLRPVGGADVPTLLLSPALRAWLAHRDGSGLAALAVPGRTRGWTDLRRVDPAYVRAAWAATDTAARAFREPLLVTADDVASPRGVGDVLAVALADPVGDSPVDPFRRPGAF